MKHGDLQPVTAGTAVLSSADSGAVPKTVLIPDLHRVAMAGRAEKMVEATALSGGYLFGHISISLTI